MPEEIHGTIEWKGGPYRECTYTCVHGTQPGQISIIIPATENWQNATPEGLDTITMSDGIGGELKLEKLHCQGPQRVRGADGIEYHVILFDRRWHWKFKPISGHYNERDPVNEIKPSSRASVKKLAELCLDAMGEQGYDIDALPDVKEDLALPEVEWVDTPAAEALDEICRKFGCRIVYQPVRDRVLIARVGTGEELPDEPFSDHSPARSQPMKPEILRVVGAPASFMAAIHLEAVGEDLDGSVVPIDDLTYKPQDGWKNSPHPTFPNLFLSLENQRDGHTIDDCYAAARKSVYRWYRVTPIDPRTGGQLEVPGLADFKDADGQPIETFNEEQLIPMDHILGTKRDEKRKLYVSPASIFGIFTDSLAGKPIASDVLGIFTGPATATITTSDTRLKVKFSVDSERRLVMIEGYPCIQNFSANDLIVHWGGDNQKQTIFAQSAGPPILTLLTSIVVLEPVTRQPVRYSRDRKINGGVKGLIQTIHVDEIQFSSFVSFTPGSWKVVDRTDNRKECDAAADLYLDAFDNFEERKTDQRVYPRLIKTDPDGAIQSIVWKIGVNGVSTTMSRNDERIPWLTPFVARRGADWAQRVAPKLDSLFRNPFLSRPAPVRPMAGTPT